VSVFGTCAIKVDLAMAMKRSDISDSPFLIIWSTMAFVLVIVIAAIITGIDVYNDRTSPPAFHYLFHSIAA